MKKGPKSAPKFFNDSFQFLARPCVFQPLLCIRKPLCTAVFRLLAGSCTQNSRPFHIFSFFMKTHNRRVDSLHRVVLPREAFSLLGWTSDEVLEAEALLAQDALLLRAQNHPRPQCCACGGAQDLVSLGGRRWLCGGPALPPRTPQTKPDLLNPPQQKAPRLY